MPPSTKPMPAGVSGTAVSSDADRAMKNAPLIPRCTPGRPRACDDEVQAHRLGRPDQPGHDDEPRQRATGRSRRRRPPRTGRRTRGPGAAAAAGDDPAPEVAHREQPAGQQQHDHDADREHDLDVGREAAPERHEAGREAEDDDREQVEHALDEHRPERARQRDRAVDLEQVRAVDVAELGRHEAVHEPRQEDDLGRVAHLEPEPAPANEHRPAQAAQREADVEDRERGEQQQRVRTQDLVRQLLELEAGQALHEQDEEHDRQDDRDDRPRLAEPPAPARAGPGGPRPPRLASSGVVGTPGSGASSGRHGRSDAAAAAGTLDELRRGREQAHVGRRAARHELARGPARAARRPSGGRGIARTGSSTRPRPPWSCARRTRRRRGCRPAARARRRGRCRRRSSGGRSRSRSSRPSRRARRARRSRRDRPSRGTGRTGARCRRGRPARGPRRRRRPARARAGSARAGRRPIRSPAVVRISWPTSTVSPGASVAARATRLEGAVDAVMVGDREVRQPARRGRAHDGRRRRQRVEARRGVAVQVDERTMPVAGRSSGLVSRPRCSGRATS